MKRHIHEMFFALALLTGSAAAAQTPEDFTRFLSWWSGDYDNLAQVRTQEAAGTPEKSRNAATLLFIRKVDAPAFGKESFYAEWRDAKQTDKVTRQRIYAFERDQARSKLRLNLHIWPADKAEFIARTSGAHLDPSKLTGVTPADMAGLKGCDVFFDVGHGQFSGAMDKGACAFPAPNGKPIYSWSQMTLTAAQFRYLDGWFNLDGTPFMRFTDEWFVFDRTPR
jgi:hypothetical protein